jgi:hypothetical protein
MRFIRDIIKEKNSKASLPVGETAIKAATSPKELLLEDPMVKPVEQKPALQVPTPAQVEDDNKEVLALLSSIDEKEWQNHEPDAPTLVRDKSSSDMQALPDPFEKLRNAESDHVSARKSASPIRKTPTIDHTKSGSGADAVVAVSSNTVEALSPLADATQATMQMPSPAIGRGSTRSGRVKTRLLGFSAAATETKDPFAEKPTIPSKFPVGWLVVVSKMGRGASFALQDGVTKVGRGTDQTVCLNFGDNSISRDNHVSIAFDAEQNKFFIGHSGKTNLVRLNNVPLLSTEQLNSKDLIRLGETTLRFIAFCADDFSWKDEQDRASQHA